MRRLQDAMTPGGVFVGVGPEQNFHYAAALKPAMVFVIDIRRQNTMQHLVVRLVVAAEDANGLLDGLVDNAAACEVAWNAIPA